MKAGHSEYMARFIPDGAVELYHDNTKMAYTSASGFEVTNGNLICHINLRVINDNQKLLIGAGNDLQLYHTGSHSYIDNKTGNLYIRANTDSDVGGDIHIRAKAGENSLSCLDDGAVQLYHDNSLKLETNSSGIEVTGTIQLDDSNHIKFGTGTDTNIHHDGSNTYIHHQGTGSLIARVVNTAFRVYGDGNATIANFIDNGAVELYHNNNKKFETTSGGASITGDLSLNADDPTLNFIDTNNNNFRITANTGVLYFADATANQTRATMTASGTWTFQGSLNAGSNNTYDLGSSSTRWRNIYTNDLNLSNEGGGGNDVDGTTGNYTIQEGADELYLINNKSGKKYKFNLTEVS